ncbi:hypothetical protein A4R35_09975 [Thermogemmatispora tikiterensis]|uniref:Uncharacterized protein n=1 Tax=Thermogemmatispora tikiterensis TaxID=1825093 RepID=A0A328VL78_9CHLR|nr:hypothetical protein A4R35_09975 [Thermogemmatispora tikiterensis]
MIEQEGLLLQGGHGEHLQAQDAAGGAGAGDAQELGQVGLDEEEEGEDLGARGQGSCPQEAGVPGRAVQAEEAAEPPGAQADAVQVPVGARDAQFLAQGAQEAGGGRLAQRSCSPSMASCCSSWRRMRATCWRAASTKSRSSPIAKRASWSRSGMAHPSVWRDGLAGARGPRPGRVPGGGWRRPLPPVSQQARAGGSGFGGALLPGDGGEQGLGGARYVQGEAGAIADQAPLYRNPTRSMDGGMRGRGLCPESR